MRARELLNLVTILGVYPDVLIVRALAPVSTRTGRGLYFTLELQHVVTAPLRQIEFVIRPTSTGPAADRAPSSRISRELEEDLPAGEQYSLTADEVFDLDAVVTESLNVVIAEGGSTIQHAQQVAHSTLDNAVAEFQAGQIVPGLGTLASGLGTTIGSAVDFVQVTGAKVAAVKEGRTSTRSVLESPMES